MMRYALPSVVVLLLLGPVLGADSGEKPLIVGLLQPEKVIVPFAIFQNGQWTNPWPKPKDYGPSHPNTIADLPSPWFKPYVGDASTWYLWGDGFAGIRVTAKKIVQTGSHCETAWGLAVTNAPASNREVSAGTKIGAVFSTDAAASPFQKISPSNALEGLIKPIFDTQETKALAAPQDDFSADHQSFPKGLDQRTSRKLSIKAVYRATLPGSRDAIEHVVAERSYEAPKGSYDQTCELVSHWEGWGHVGASTRVIESTITLTDCDYKNVGYTEPFAMIVLQGKRFLVVQESGYESENYTIYLLDGRLQRALTTSGGGC